MVIGLGWPGPEISGRQLERQLMTGELEIGRGRKIRNRILSYRRAPGWIRARRRDRDKHRGDENCAPR
jgi:hypothetical protein